MKILKYLTLALIVGLVFYGFDAAAAQNTGSTGQVWTNAFNTMVRVFKNVRTIVYVVGAFGLIALAVGGIMGKIDFKKLGYLAAGLAIVAVADLIIRWITTDAATGTAQSKSDIDIREWDDS